MKEDQGDPCNDAREVLVRRATEMEAAMEAMSMKNDEGGRRTTERAAENDKSPNPPKGFGEVTYQK